jgi:hypothetical protein
MAADPAPPFPLPHTGLSRGWGNSGSLNSIAAALVMARKQWGLGLSFGHLTVNLHMELCFVLLFISVLANFFFTSYTRNFFLCYQGYWYTLLKMCPEPKAPVYSRRFYFKFLTPDFSPTHGPFVCVFSLTVYLPNFAPWYTENRFPRVSKIER